MNRAFIALLLLAVMLSYANSLHNQFIWDDEDWILKNSTVKDWLRWPSLFTQNSIQGARKGSNFYRPLQAISHGIDYLLWGHKLPGHHAAGIAFHAFAAIALFLLLKTVFSQRISFLTAFFFAVHPVQTEAVTYISGRADPMSALFILLTILFFERNIFLSGSFFVLGILSKEFALITPFMLLFYLLFKGVDIKAGVRRLIPFASISLIYGIMRLTILNFSSTIPENAPKAFSYIPIYIRLSTFLKTLPVYFKALIWPFALHMERDIDLSYSVFQPQSLFGLLIMCAVFLIGFKFRKQCKILVFAAAWFFIGIFPNSNIIPINALIYEHWLYLPSVGFFLVIAWGIDSLFKKGRAFKVISVFLAMSISIFYIWRTYERNKEWRNPIVFYESTIRYKPDSLRLRNNLAMAYIDAGREEDAIREYKKAISLGDYYPQPHYNLSNIYLNRGDYRAAIRELKKSLEIDNGFLYSHESLALIYFNQGRFDEAKKEALFILEREPDNKVGREVLEKVSF
ncbi:MAG: tetratricopeptide repeat protein [Candidatus Omnitrophica bacterium]|nr:tetratricopeptide repeat protein [Candidatus Omnitrophota bacterium]